MLCNQGTPKKVRLEGEKELGACRAQKISEMGFDRVGCFMRKTFMNESGMGKTKVDVRSQIAE